MSGFVIAKTAGTAYKGIGGSVSRGVYNLEDTNRPIASEHTLEPQGGGKMMGRESNIE